MGACVLAMAGMLGAEAATGEAFWRYGFVAASLAAAGILAVLWSHGTVTTRQVLVLGILFRLCFVPLPPLLSDDAYRYVWDGVVQHRDVNPYRYVPADPALAGLQDDPVYEALNSKTYYSVYPPASQLLFRAAGAAYPLGWRVPYYLLRGIFLLFELAALGLLARMVAPRALMLYAWNPLVLVEGSAHTEALLVFGLVLTVWAVQRGRHVLAGGGLAVAAWAKLYPFVLVPLLLRRGGWRSFAGGLAVVAGLAVPYAEWFVLPHVRDSLDLYVRLFEFNAGPYYAMKELFHQFTGTDWSKTLGPALRAAFLAALPVAYVLDARWRWSLPAAFLVVLTLFYACATTVHPWYLLAVMPLVALREPGWHWQWLAALSLGTYLFYVGGPYGVFVAVGWGGWLVLGVATRRRAIVDGVMRRRARRKARCLAPWLGADAAGTEGQPRLLDLGAAEGYVGRELEGLGWEVVLADVVDMNRTALPHAVYDGRRLPFEANAFDVTVLYFVLHHAVHPEAVIREALRVTRGRVLVVESVYDRSWQRRLLHVLDPLANRLRGGEQMRVQEAHLAFRTAEGWRHAFEEAGGRVVAEERFGSALHRQVLVVAERLDSVIANQKNGTCRTS